MITNHMRYIVANRAKTRPVFLRMRSRYTRGMTDLVVTLPTDPGLRESLSQAEGIVFETWDLTGSPPTQHIDIVVPPYWGGVKRLANLAGVNARLVQWQSIGYNGVDRYLPKGLPFANAATVHETSTAELALTLVLASQRGIPDFVRDGEDHVWNLRTFPSLADRRVLLIGYGGVGKAIEARLGGFEAGITRLARTARVERNLAGDQVRVHGFDELHARLSEADIVILGVPLTDETRHLIDAAALAALPDGALVVNVARGPVVDTEALMRELNSGRLRAALDVTDPEPLPEDHPLWRCPGLLITPHAGGDSTAMLPRMSALILRQAEALRAGRTPENIVLGD